MSIFLVTYVRKNPFELSEIHTPVHQTTVTLPGQPFCCSLRDKFGVIFSLLRCLLMYNTIVSRTLVRATSTENCAGILCCNSVL